MGISSADRKKASQMASFKRTHAVAVYPEPSMATVKYTTAMQFLSVSRRLVDKFPPEAFTPELAAKETARVRELYAIGILRQVWKRSDTPGAGIIWEAASEAEARAAVESLPLFQAGLLEIAIFIPLAPYPGFGPSI
jgi:muconolactone delta-isomerase